MEASPGAACSSVSDPVHPGGCSQEQTQTAEQRRPFRASGPGKVSDSFHGNSEAGQCEQSKGANTFRRVLVEVVRFSAPALLLRACWLLNKLAGLRISVANHLYLCSSHVTIVRGQV